MKPENPKVCPDFKACESPGKNCNQGYACGYVTGKETAIQWADEICTDHYKSALPYSFVPRRINCPDCRKECGLE